MKKLVLNSAKKIFGNALYKNRQKKIEKILRNSDFSKIENERNITKIKTIAFVLPRMGAYSGGTTSILRMGTFLQSMGYTVSYISLAQQSEDDMMTNAKINLENFGGKVLNYSDDLNFDVVVATAWETAYTVKKMYGYKMYFVQDFEPLFCTDGETYALAQKTYDLGLHMVSLGSWNKQMILKNTKETVKIDVVEFPYEKSEYEYFPRDFSKYKGKTKIQLAVFLKDVGRRIPTITQHVLLEAKECFRRDNIDLHIIAYGGIKKIPKELGVNRGKLSKKELSNLYKESDFGMVASMTNISLVPYEMLASGLPLIEFKDGSYEDFLGNDTATLIDFSGQELYIKIKELIDETYLLKQKDAKAQEKLKKLSWQKTGQQFLEILKKLEKKDEI